MSEIWWVASANPVKARAVAGALHRLYPRRVVELRALALPSDVAAQPLGEAETRRGARQRVLNARDQQRQGVAWVGLEGGVVEIEGSLYAFTWAAVGADLRGEFRIITARSASFPLPEEVAKRVRAGEELGVADDAVFGATNSKQAGGAVGLLSGGVLGRAELYATAVLLALLPFGNPQLQW